MHTVFQISISLSFLGSKAGLRTMNKTKSNRILVQKNRWKEGSSKKLSARKRGVFVDKKPRSLGLEFSKKGFCFFTNEVLCANSEEFASGSTDRCFACPTYKRVMQEMEDEDEEFDAEFDGGI